MAGVNIRTYNAAKAAAQNYNRMRGVAKRMGVDVSRIPKADWKSALDPHHPERMPTTESVRAYKQLYDKYTTWKDFLPSSQNPKLSRGAVKTYNREMKLERAFKSAEINRISEMSVKDVTPADLRRRSIYMSQLEQQKPVSEIDSTLRLFNITRASQLGRVRTDWRQINAKRYIWIDQLQDIQSRNPDVNLEPMIDRLKSMTFDEFEKLNEESEGITFGPSPDVIQRAANAGATVYGSEGMSTDTITSLKKLNNKLAVEDAEGNRIPPIENLDEMLYAYTNPTI